MERQLPPDNEIVTQRVNVWVRAQGERNFSRYVHTLFDGTATYRSFRRYGEFYSDNSNRHPVNVQRVSFLRGMQLGMITYSKTLPTEKDKLQAFSVGNDYYAIQRDVISDPDVEISSNDIDTNVRYRINELARIALKTPPINRYEIDSIEKLSFFGKETLTATESGYGTVRRISLGNGFILPRVGDIDIGLETGSIIINELRK